MSRIGPLAVVVARFLLSRLAYVALTLFVVTAALYGIIMLAPVEARASLYLPPRIPQNQSAEVAQRILERLIREHKLDQPYPVQYAHWIGNLARGDWGWSTLLRASVLDALLARLPATAELTIYSALFLIPLGLASGILAGWRQGRPVDVGFRAVAFSATSVPPFILGIVMLALCYVGLGWFAPGRTSSVDVIRVTTSSFNRITGLLTVDGLLNGRLDITLDALRHLLLPVLALSAAHWATLGRITRAAMIEELGKDYVTSARARGLPAWRVVWRHALRNAIPPGLTSVALSAASLVTSVYVIEAVFDFPGLSQLVAGSLRGVPDSSVAMGFAVFSVLLVLPVMIALDALQTLADPRLRTPEGDTA
jgi:ABC-type dipeptide/oligopeptide/nickel transport system permease component